jgi:hypothetical protein
MPPESSPHPNLWVLRLGSYSPRVRLAQVGYQFPGGNGEWLEQPAGMGPPGLPVGTGGFGFGVLAVLVVGLPVGLHHDGAGMATAGSPARSSTGAPRGATAFWANVRGVVCSGCDERPGSATKPSTRPQSRIHSREYHPDDHAEHRSGLGAKVLRPTGPSAWCPGRRTRSRPGPARRRDHGSPAGPRPVLHRLDGGRGSWSCAARPTQ